MFWFIQMLKLYIVRILLLTWFKYLSFCFEFSLDLLVVASSICEPKIILKCDYCGLNDRYLKMCFLGLMMGWMKSTWQRTKLWGVSFIFFLRLIQIQYKYKTKTNTDTNTKKNRRKKKYKAKINMRTNLTRNQTPRCIRVEVARKMVDRVKGAAWWKIFFQTQIQI